MDRFKLMETYVTVVRLGSFTSAARELGVTRAMTSRRVQELEHELGVRLLNRNSHGLNTTGVGADYYRRCVELLDDLFGLDEQIKAARSEPAGKLRVLCSKTFGETILAPLVSDFCGAYPDVSIQLTLRDRDSRQRGMDSLLGDFDIAICTLPSKDSVLRARPIYSLPRVVVAAPTYLSRNGYPKVPQDLVGCNCLDPSGAPRYTWNFDGPGGRCSLTLEGTPNANSSIVIREAARRGRGIAMLSEYIVAESLAAGSLVPLLPDYAVEERKLYVLYQPDPHQPAAIRAFVDFLMSHVKEGGAGQKPRGRLPKADLSTNRRTLTP